MSAQHLGAALLLSTALALVSDQINPPACDTVPDVVAAWQTAWNTLGIAPVQADPGLGDLAAKRWLGQGNWYPVDGTNEVLCGRLRDWSEFNGAPATPHEFDVHPHISPAQSFGFLLNDLQDYSQDSAERCKNASSQRCLWGEVTPPEDRRETLFGGSTVADIQRKYVNHATCVYGPWLMESVHGWLPEIHPYRALWMADDAADAKSTRLVFVRDSSNRFELTGDRQYAQIGPHSGPAWAPHSLDETVGVAYQLHSGQHADLNVTVPTGNQTQHKFDHSFGDSSVTVHLPVWLGSPSVKACRVGTGDQAVTRAIEWVHADLDPRPGAPDYEGAAVAMNVTRSGGDEPPVAPLLQQFAFQRARGAALRLIRPLLQPIPKTSTPVLGLRLIGVDHADDTIENASLTKLSTRFWQLGTAPDPQWRASSDLRFHVLPYYAGGTDTAEHAADELNDAILRGEGRQMTITWKASAESFDNAPHGVGVSDTNDRFFFGVSFSGGAGLKTKPPAAKKRLHVLAGTAVGMDRWEQGVHVSPPTAALDEQNPTSAVLHLTATVRDDHGITSGPLVLDVPTHVPAVDVQPAKEPSDAFLGLVTAWIRAARSDLPPSSALMSALRNDWQSEPGHLISNDAVRRRARIFRARYLQYVADGDLDAFELNELFGMARTWADLKWPLVAPGMRDGKR